MLAKASPKTEYKETTTDIHKTKNNGKLKILKDMVDKRRGVAIIAAIKPSRVLFGLTFVIKGLLPRLLPAKNAIESMRMAIKTI